MRLPDEDVALQVDRDLSQRQRRDARQHAEQRPADQPRIVRARLAQEPPEGRVHRETFAAAPQYLGCELTDHEVLIRINGLFLSQRRPVDRPVPRLPQARLRDVP